jgi:hypothetical protein
MSGVSPQRLEVERKIQAVEDETAERLASIRVLEEQWDDYRRVMRDSADVFEEAGVAMDAKNYFVQKSLASRRELENYLAQLSREHAEELAEVAQEVRSTSDEKLEQLQRERTGAPWA